MKRYILIAIMGMLAYVAKAQQFNNGAEFFLEILDRGSYSVLVDGEMVGSTTGRFRFYDLRPGRNLVSIQYNGKQIFKDFVLLSPGSRTIASLGRNRLRINTDLQIYRNGQYALDNWNGQLYSNRPDYDNRPERVYQREMRPEDFSRLLSLVRNEAFDGGKQNIVRAALRDNCLSVGQLAVLLKQFSFDDKRLECAFDAYPSVANPANFYQLRDEFTFMSSKEKFDKFLAGR